MGFRERLGWLVSRPDEPGIAIARRTRLYLNLLLLMANVVGAAVVFALSLWAFPLPSVEDPDAARLAGVIGFAILVPIGSAVGSYVGTRKLRAVRTFLEADRAPTDEERRAVLRAPLTVARVHAAIWALAAIGAGSIGAAFSAELGQRVATTVALGGVTTSAVAFLVAERQLRATAARALAANPVGEPVGPGVQARALIAWAVGTGIPILGLILVAISTLVEGDFNAEELAVTILALSGVALVFGIYVLRLASRAVADPVLSVRDAMGAVERGELDVEVPVYDGSEVGLLQAGFNRMAEGLRERERIRDRFGRQVGEEVARAALEEDVELGGETRTVAILFSDVVGSTRIAAARDPHEVVEMLNAFFAVVVEVVREHGGWVNKFEGDAALAVFGAPVEIEDPAGRCLAAARRLAARLRQERSELEAAVGIAYGEVVAGNVGEERRFEYTVIGDPVNEAARLTELAKGRSPMVLASSAAVDAATEREASLWKLGDSVELRGRSRPTRLACPAD